MYSILWVTFTHSLSTVYSFIRVGQGFWVYGIQGHFKSGIQYFYAEKVLSILLFLNFRYKVYSLISFYFFIRDCLPFICFMTVMIMLWDPSRMETSTDRYDTPCIKRIFQFGAWHDHRWPNCPWTVLIKACKMVNGGFDWGFRSSGLFTCLMLFVPTRWTETNREMVDLHTDKGGKLFISQEAFDYRWLWWLSTQSPRTWNREAWL